MEQATISQQFADMYYLELKEGRRVRTSEFLATVNSVLSRIRQNNSYFERIVKDSVIKFVYNDECVPTMSVDDRGNVYVSVNYIVLSLNMDEELIYALFLNAYYTIKDQHLDQEKKFLDNGMPKGSWGAAIRRGHKVQLTIPIHHDINIVFEHNANHRIIRDHANSIKRMNAVHVDSESPSLLSTWYYHEVMNKLRGDVNHTFPLTPSVRPLPDTFSFGYANTMRYLNEVVKACDKNVATSLAANITMQE